MCKSGRFSCLSSIYSYQKVNSQEAGLKSNIQKRSESEDIKIGSGALAPHAIKSHHEAGLKYPISKREAEVKPIFDKFF